MARKRRKSPSKPRKGPRPCPPRCNVLLIGGGGREHALAWKLKQSPRMGDLWLTDPGNGGLARLGKPCPHKIDLKNPFHMANWLESAAIDLIVVGPEQPLADGIVDVFQTEQTIVFGPKKAAAQLEANKAFAKQLMRQAAIPTAEGRTFERAEYALEYIRNREDPCVVKASGLAAGKGAIVCDTQEEAIAAVELIMTDRAFGDAGKTIVVEDKLVGPEVSILALVDGRTIFTLDPCQDHKQVGEGDTGPNTGGMGAYTPTPPGLLTAEVYEEVERDIIVPTIDALRRDDIEYRGVLYVGLMLTAAGPKVLEFNCRFGDPECQPLMARLQGDLIEILWATATGTLDQIKKFGFDKRTACCVVMCSGGYPGEYDKGKVITGIDDAESIGDREADEQVIVFHAGTTVNHHGELVTSGGRVVGVTALADDLARARDLANEGCAKIKFDGAFWRSDIGNRELARV